MIDPANVIVQCPNGHELQAAREHLTVALSCPMCGVKFVPQTAEAAIEVDAASRPSESVLAPATEPVDYPGYTNWMLGLWIFSIAIVLVIPPLLETVTGKTMTAGDNSLRDTPLMKVFTPMACVGLIGLPAAVVLQLIWIYHVHRDARSGGNYDEISPGLALGLSFIPVFNCIWTAWLMRKLSIFSGKDQTVQDADQSRRSDAAKSAATLAIVAAVIGSILVCVIFSYGAVVAMQAGEAAGGFGPNLNRALYHAEVEKNRLPAWGMLIVFSLVLVMTLIYCTAVKKTESALYSALGATPRT